MTDLKTGAAFPTDHPAHAIAPFNVLPKPAREIMGAADAILALDWVDLGGALRQGKAVGNVTAKIISATLDHHLHNGFNMDYQALPPVDVMMAAAPDGAVAELVEALGGGRKDPWRARIAGKPRAVEQNVTLHEVAAALKTALDPAKVSLATLGRGWPFDVWPLRDPLAYLGKDGGGGIGSGPGISVGAALGLQARGRYAVSMLGDGDFIMGAHALWTAVRHRIPLLILINNNRSYFNDELHQETVAHTRGREPKNRWIGQRLADPEPEHRQAGRGAGRGRHRAGHACGRGKGRGGAGRRGAQVGRRLRDRFPHRAGRGTPSRRVDRPARDGRVIGAHLRRTRTFPIGCAPCSLRQRLTGEHVGDGPHRRSRLDAVRGTDTMDVRTGTRISPAWRRRT